MLSKFVTLLIDEKILRNFKFCNSIILKTINIAFQAFKKNDKRFM